MCSADVTIFEEISKVCILVQELDEDKTEQIYNKTYIYYLLHNIMCEFRLNENDKTHYIYLIWLI